MNDFNITKAKYNLINPRPEIISKVFNGKFSAEPIKLSQEFKKLWENIKKAIKNGKGLEKLYLFIDILKTDNPIDKLGKRFAFELANLITYARGEWSEKLLGEQVKVLERFTIGNNVVLVTEEKIAGSGGKKGLFLYMIGENGPGMVPYVLITEYGTKVPLLNILSFYQNPKLKFVFAFKEKGGVYKVRRSHIEVSNLEKEGKKKMDEIVEMIKSKKQGNEV